MFGRHFVCNRGIRVLALKRMQCLVRGVVVMVVKLVLGKLLLKIKTYLYGLLKVKDAKICHMKYIF